MKNHQLLKHEFVEFIPDNTIEGTIYISIKYATIVHKCVCGCGSEVVTPLSPTDWQLAFDGVSISLYPSIGNWQFECRSHYWIRNNQVRWARSWSEEEIDSGRNFDKSTKEAFYRSETIAATATIKKKIRKKIFGSKRKKK